jgi:hypothetical protein
MPSRGAAASRHVSRIHPNRDWVACLHAAQPRVGMYHVSITTATLDPSRDLPALYVAQRCQGSGSGSSDRVACLHAAQPRVGMFSIYHFLARGCRACAPNPRCPHPRHTNDFRPVDGPFPPQAGTGQSFEDWYGMAAPVPYIFLHLVLTEFPPTASMPQTR